MLPCADVSGKEPGRGEGARPPGPGIQHAGHLGLGGRLDHTSQNHLLKGPIAPDRLTQAQTLIGAVQDLPQQPGVLGCISAAAIL